MYEEASRTLNNFKRCLVSSTMQKYCEKEGKTMLFPQLPRKAHDFGKNRAFLGKNKRATLSAWENQEKIAKY